MADLGVLALMPGAWPSSPPAYDDLIPDAPHPRHPSGSSEAPNLPIHKKSVHFEDSAGFSSPQSSPFATRRPPSRKNKRNNFVPNSTRLTPRTNESQSLWKKSSTHQKLSPSRKARVEELIAKRKENITQERHLRKQNYRREHRDASSSISRFSSISESISHAHQNYNEFRDKFGPALSKVSQTFTFIPSSLRFWTKPTTTQPLIDPEVQLAGTKHALEEEEDDNKLKYRDIEPEQLALSGLADPDVLDPDVLLDPFTRTRKAKYARFDIPFDTKDVIPPPRYYNHNLVSVYQMRNFTRTSKNDSDRPSHRRRPRSPKANASNPRHSLPIPTFFRSWFSNAADALNPFAGSTGASARLATGMGEHRPQSAPATTQTSHQSSSDSTDRDDTASVPDEARNARDVDLISSFYSSPNNQGSESSFNLAYLTKKLTLKEPHDDTASLKNVYPEYEQQVKPSELRITLQERNEAQKLKAKTLYRDVAEETAQKALQKEQRKQEEQAREEAASKLRAKEARRQEIREGNRRELMSPLVEEWETKVSKVQEMKNEDAEVTPRLNRHDFGTLVPKFSKDGIGWLNDTIIMEFINLIATKGLENSGQKNTGKPPKDAPKFHSFNSHLYSKWESVKTTNPGSDPYQAVARWIERAGLAGSRLSQAEMVFIPINSGSHWTLLMVSGTKKTITYYDSMGGSGQKYLRFALDLVAGILGKDFKEAEWTVEAGTSTRQTNGLDCGVFVCMNALALMKSLEPSNALNASQMSAARRYIAAVLMQGGFTEDFDF